MTTVRPVRPEKRSVIPAVTHFDGTGRLQTVGEEVNPRFYAVIAEFERLTGVPVVVNTSFDLAGEPIVRTPDEAIATFKQSGLDALAMGDYLCLKARDGTRGWERDSGRSAKDRKGPERITSGRESIPEFLGWRKIILGTAQSGLPCSTYVPAPLSLRYVSPGQVRWPLAPPATESISSAVRAIPGYSGLFRDNSGGQFFPRPPVTHGKNHHEIDRFPHSAKEEIRHSKTNEGATD